MLEKMRIRRPLMECNRRALVKGLGGAILGLAPFLKACNRLSGEFQSREEKMQTGQNRSMEAVPRKPIPPIDVAAPSRVETATFALG
jgi:hypothetical protein